MNETKESRIENEIAKTLGAIGDQQTVLDFLLAHFRNDTERNDSFAISIILGDVIQRMTDLSGELDHFSAQLSRERRGTAK